MPFDKNAEEEDLREERRKRAYTDYDCPTCNANNPVDLPLRDGDETRCNYCGAEYKVRITDEGRLRLKEL
jgi:DNA-directed RNA polymerase subunit RPC12/RpoP